MVCATREFVFNLVTFIVIFSTVSELFIKLEDVTAKFSSPCIMDVKVGDFYANAKKFARWKVRCPALDDVRFQVDGVKVGL